MNITVDSTRKVIDMSAKSYGWDSWLKVREDIQLAKTLTDAEREHRIYYVRCPEDTRNLFWLTPQTRYRRSPNNLGEMLCPNVAKLAQEKTFAVGEGVVIQ